jgi:hypothetical protein
MLIMKNCTAMNYLRKHPKSLAYLLTSLLLSQSCVIYDPTSVSNEIASQTNDGAIRITTTKGDIYKLNWVEEQGDNLVSIKNTERIFLVPEKIVFIKVLAPNPFFITADSLFSYTGNTVIAVKEGRGIREYDFFKIENVANLIQGLTMVNSDTSTITIPKNQIEKIEVKDKTGSTAGNIAIGVGVVVALVGTIAIIDISQNGIGISW